MPISKLLGHMMRTEIFENVTLTGHKKEERQKEIACNLPNIIV